MSLPTLRARTLAAAALGFFASTAWAEDALPDRMATVDTVEATRWPASVDGENPVTLRLDKGAEVDILTQAGDQLRVRQGLTFGWVAKAQLGEAGAQTPTIQLGAPPPSFR